MHFDTYRQAVKISIELKADNEIFRVSVNDNGSGIPPEDLPDIFDRSIK